MLQIYRDSGKSGQISELKSGVGIVFSKGKEWYVDVGVKSN